MLRLIVPFWKRNQNQVKVPNTMIWKQLKNPSFAVCWGLLTAENNDNN